jgi:hypothetical protein
MPPIELRGNESSLYWKCDVCGQRRYAHAGRFINTYLVAEEIANRPLFLAYINFLVMEEYIYKRICINPDWAKIKRKLKFEKIRVLEKPLDGYPEILLQYTPTITREEVEEKSIKNLQKHYKQYVKSSSCPCPGVLESVQNPESGIEN